MADEKRISQKHTVVINKRENMAVTGVLDVISFDDETIVAETDMGVMVLQGANLHVSRLNLESGELEIDGEIVSFNYEEQATFSKGKSSFLGKLFK